jgi:hypothetical protein
MADRDDGAHLAVARARLGAGLEASPTRYLRLSVDLAGEHSRHDWRHPERLGAPELSRGEEPWDELQSVSAAFGAQVFLGPRWSLIARAGLSAGFEAGADLGDALSGSLGLSVGRRFDDGRLTIGLGVLGIARLEQSPLVVPALFVRWAPLEWLVLETAGPGLRLTARAHDALDVTLRGGFELRDWRLDDRRTRLAEAVVQDTRVIVALGVVWRPADRLALRAEVGLYPYTEVLVRDRRGDEVRRLQGELTGVVLLGLELTL